MSTETMITIYSKDGCPYCVKAIDYSHELVGEAATKVIKNPEQSVVDELKATHDHHTYPFVFVGTEFIGGYSALVEDYVKVVYSLKKQFGFEIEF